ncbi:hypothetical protein [Streptomyces sp. ALI-76-A]|uniref:hypothetical protein n=1 Tax=Streptomyces sp. ALI-76-A TaxID=3025736 RepID=UPI00256ED794|nr:hypothetical protein [Streptomyces sp. ALI-76-A]MDL5200710.1 hypothetical protein [Streptomyces sp. ALI-76-A]
MSDSVPEAQARAEAEGPPADAPRPPYTPVEPEHVPTGPEYGPAGPAPLHVPRTPTGNTEVDAQLARLGDADHLATDGHLEVYEDVHRGLRDALTALDARPGPPAPPSTYRSRS